MTSTLIMVQQRNWWIFAQSGFIGSFHEPWSKWSLIQIITKKHTKVSLIIDSHLPSGIPRLLTWNEDNDQGTVKITQVGNNWLANYKKCPSVTVDYLWIMCRGQGARTTENDLVITTSLWKHNRVYEKCSQSPFVFMATGRLVGDLLNYSLAQKQFYGWSSDHHCPVCKI